MDRLHHTMHHNLLCLHTGQQTMQVLGSAAPDMNINEGT